MNWDWSFDGWIIITGMLCAAAASLLGNFLVLRKLSMLGDAISHAVLPGLAAAFLISGSRNSLPMFIGAVIVGALTALLTEWIRRFGRVEEGAAMGVVFTTLFALGLVLIVRAADKVDLDAGCVLYGAIELTPLDTVDVAGYSVPRAAVVLAAVLAVNALFVVVFFKELKLTSFDESLADSLGFSSRLMHYALMVLVAITAVASFESVGNILVVAMFIVPPAAAGLLTHRLGVMIVLSLLIAAGGAAAGHVAAVAGPPLFGYRSTTTAGMMAVAVGLLFLLALLLSPNQGLLPRWWRQFSLSLAILQDDILAWLYRAEEHKKEAVDADALRVELLASRPLMAVALWRLGRVKQIVTADRQLHLSDEGRRRAAELVRSHRLWESYLVQEVALEADRIHDKAERWEHFTDRQLRDQLAGHAADARDPHGSQIPPEE